MDKLVSEIVSEWCQNDTECLAALIRELNDRLVDLTEEQDAIENIIDNLTFNNIEGGE